MADAAAAFRRTATAARRVPAEWVRASANLTARATRATLKADTGGDGRLSRFRDGSPRAVVKISARYGATLSEAAVMAAGAQAIWSWLEDGTGGHRVAAREAEALATPAGVFDEVHVSGRRPLRTWRRAVDPVLPRCDADADRRWRTVIR